VTRHLGVNAETLVIQILSGHLGSGLSDVRMTKELAHSEVFSPAMTA